MFLSNICGGNIKPLEGKYILIRMDLISLHDAGKNYITKKEDDTWVHVCDELQFCPR